MSVTRRYLNGQTYLKAFWTPILVFWPLNCADTHFQLPPSAGAQNTRGVGNLSIFDWNHDLSRKRYVIGPWPWVTSDPCKVNVEGHKLSISKTVRLRDYKTLLGNHIQSIEWYHFQWPWMTSDPDFKVTTFFEVESEELMDKVYCSTLIGNHT